MAANAESSILHYGEPKSLCLGAPRWRVCVESFLRQQPDGCIAGTPQSCTMVNQKAYALVR
jgi:hypothetical protein